MVELLYPNHGKVVYVYIIDAKHVNLQLRRNCIVQSAKIHAIA